MESDHGVNVQAVFVETNWVVDVIAPAHLQSLKSVQLLEQANAGLFELYLPAICLIEARETVLRRFAPRSRSDDFRKFVKWARDQGRITIEDASAAFRVFNQFDSLVAHELAETPKRLTELAENPGLKIFPLSETMLERQVEIGAIDGLFLKPYDLAVLAAILVQAENLRSLGYSQIIFCELDSDLQPWDKSGARKPILSDLYDYSRIFVQGDFLLERIE
jgi:predicted nucleic acid-binding protein